MSKDDTVKEEMREYLEVYDAALTEYFDKFGEWATDRQAHEFALKVVELEQGRQIHEDNQYTLGMIHG